MSFSLRSEQRPAAIRREQAVAAHIPFTAHVAENVLKTLSGDFVQSFRLGGASFESADDDQLNNWHERLNVTWRNIASPNVALWVHVIRRRERFAGEHVRDDDFAGRLAAKYQKRLATETLMVNDLYLSVVYRPVAGAASGLVSKALAKRPRHRSEEDLDAALDACAKLGQTIAASLARYEPEALGIYLHGRKPHSALLEFLALLVNGEYQRMPLPRAPIADALATTRPVFGTEVIEYRLPTETRVGAVLGIKEYPTPTSVGMYNALLSAPFPFVLTQSFSFLSKATGQGLLQRQSTLR